MNGQIFKFQVSLTKPKMVLVYNEDKSIMGQWPFDKSTLKIMGKKKKAFFYGFVAKGKINTNKNCEVKSFKDYL